MESVPAMLPAQLADALGAARLDCNNIKVHIKYGVGPLRASQDNTYLNRAVLIIK